MAEDELDPEALRPVDASTLNIADRLNKQKDKITAEVVTAGNRRRGRPPGTPNKPKAEEDKTPEERQRDDERKRQLKARKTDEYTKKIVEEFNDQILLFFVGQGVPSAVLFKDGKAPTPVVDGRYTEFGNRLAIKPMQARFIASFVADLEYTEGGSKLASTLTNNTVGTVVKGLLAGYAAMTYVKGLTDTYKELEPLLKQVSQLKAQQEAEKAAQQETSYGQ